MSATEAQLGLDSEHEFRGGFELEFEVGFKLEVELEFEFYLKVEFDFKFDFRVLRMQVRCRVGVRGRFQVGVSNSISM